MEAYRRAIHRAGDRLGRIGRDGPAVEGLARAQRRVRRRTIEEDRIRVFLGFGGGRTGGRKRLIALEQATEKDMRRTTSIVRARMVSPSPLPRAIGAAPDRERI